MQLVKDMQLKFYKEELERAGWCVSLSGPDEKADDQADADAGEFGPGFYKDLGELHAKVTVPAEDVMIGVRRRQTTIFNSVTDVGKTTVILNHCLAAAGGQKWDPLLPEAPDRPLKVIFVDAESTDDELRTDTENMLATIGNKEIARANFIPVLAQEVQIDGQMLDLSNRKHFLHLKNFVKYHQPDILVLETMSALFSLNNENDNAEIARKVVRPLKELTKAGNCAVLMSHHIGQAGESDQREGAYIGRGASAFGGSLRAVISLKKDKQRGPGFVTLKIEKAKAVKPDPITLELKGRTFLLCGQQPEPVQTPYQKVVNVFNGHPLRRKDVEDLLPGLGKRTIADALAKALKAGELTQPKTGSYQKPDRANCADPIGNAHSAHSAQPVEPAEDIRDLWDEGENGHAHFETDDESRFLDAMAE